MATSSLSQVIQVLKKSLAPVPKYPFKPGNDSDDASTGLLADIARLGPADYKTLLDYVHTAATGEEDDSSLLLERLVTLLSKLPDTSKEGKLLTDGFVDTLWGALEHPPTSKVSNGQDRYRSADGSRNNLRDPTLGAANTPYARTTQALTFQGPDFPDPEAIFDSLMTRGDGASFLEHPNKISSMLFYLATIITHDCFQTVSETENKTDGVPLPEQFRPGSFTNHLFTESSRS
jgi:linoleate 8R-lipoxygenase / 9,12-octadecadienoate 8-hydroperoxide 8S-isomerase